MGGGTGGGDAMSSSMCRADWADLGLMGHPCVVRMRPCFFHECVYDCVCTTVCAWCGCTCTCEASGAALLQWASPSHPSTCWLSHALHPGPIFHFMTHSPRLPPATAITRCHCPPPPPSRCIASDPSGGAVTRLVPELTGLVRRGEYDDADYDWDLMRGTLVW